MLATPGELCCSPTQNRVLGLSKNCTYRIPRAATMVAFSSRPSWITWLIDLHAGTRHCCIRRIGTAAATVVTSAMYSTKSRVHPRCVHPAAYRIQKTCVHGTTWGSVLCTEQMASAARSNSLDRDQAIGHACPRAYAAHQLRV